MAPEQVEGADLTVATDVFALGMTLYGAACCDLPARGEEQHPHLHHALRPIAQRRNLRERLSTVIDQCLQLDPSARPTLREVRSSLQSMSRKLDELEQRFL